MASKIRFPLKGWKGNAKVNGQHAGTGHLTVELDNTVNVKNLAWTTFLFMLDDVAEALQKKKQMKITTNSGDVIEFKADPKDLEGLGRLIEAEAKTKSA